MVDVAGCRDASVAPHGIGFVNRSRDVISEQLLARLQAFERVFDEELLDRRRSRRVGALLLAAFSSWVLLRFLVWEHTRELRLELAPNWTALDWLLPFETTFAILFGVPCVVASGTLRQWILRAPRPFWPVAVGGGLVTLQLVLPVGIGLALGQLDEITCRSAFLLDARLLLSDHLIVPAKEEFFYRAVVMTGAVLLLRSTRWAVVGAIVPFTMVHIYLYPTTAWASFIFSAVVYGWAFVATQSLWGAALVHALYNVQTTVLFQVLLREVPLSRC